jgi:putative heme-binding domain-containing protein
MQARAFWLLAKSDKKYIERALEDENPDLRIAGIRAARLHNLDLVATLTPLLEDPSAQVRREIAIAIRHLEAEEQPRMWATLAKQHDGQDRWYLEALGIASDLNADACFAAWVEDKDHPVADKASRDIVWRVRSKAALPLMKEAILAAHPETDSTEILRFFRAFDFHREAEKQAVLSSLLKAEHPQQTQIMVLALKHSDKEQVRKNPELRSYIEKALTAVQGTRDYLDLVETYELTNQTDALITMAGNHLESELGAEALTIALRMGGDKQIASKIRQSDTTQAIAWVQALGRVNSNESRNFLKPMITNSSENLAVRKAAITSLGSGGWGGENQLLDMVKNGEIPTELKETTAQHLAQAHRESVRKEAALYLDIPEQATNKALPPISQLVAREGNGENGEKIFFTKGCNTCHQVNGKGVDFGPNLSEIGNKLSKGAMFVSILYPDEGINFGYEGFVIKLNNGQEEVGYIASETEDEIQLKKMGGVTSTIPKSDILSREALENSLMTNLSAAMSEQELVDLVAYLSSLKKAAISSL